MLDKILAIVSLLTLAAFVSVILIGVHEVDLWLVNFLVLGIAGYFLWQEIKAGGSHVDDKSGDGKARK